MLSYPHPSTSHTPAIQSSSVPEMVDLTTPPSGGAATRRYLSALAQAGGSYFDDSSDTDQACAVGPDNDPSTSESEEETLPVVEVTQSRASQSSRRQTWTKTKSAPCLATANDILTNQVEPRLCGYVNDEFSNSGVVTDEDEYNVSRTSEVLHCIAAPENGGKPCFLPFLTHSFEEFIWQAKSDAKAMIVILLPVGGNRTNYERITG
ncbi:uncharacterized protein LOC114948682 isoform X2 [Acropora millepora]|uniref:uncharacterized protein LOC114948682 isoform X2 n=1 Tax=Acropora millepora TaxID=45264 RepID=UPI001CF49DAE|nr:uncharacterized protein LOC114948682 isoform X2 [Acropora millepora]